MMKNRCFPTPRSTARDLLEGRRNARDDPILFGLLGEEAGAHGKE